LRKLFSLDCTTSSDTHDTCGCKRCPKFEDAKELGLDRDEAFKDWEEQIDEADEQKLDEWAHHHRVDKVPDDMMKRSAGEDVSFVFSLKVEGCAIADNKNTENKQSDAPKPASEGASKPTSGAPPARTLNNVARVPPTRPPMASAAQKPAKFVPPSRRPLTEMNAPSKSAYQKPTFAAKPPTKKPKAPPKRKKAIESESEEESEAATSESEEESEEESEADEDAVPDSEDENDDDVENNSAGTKRPPAKTDARPTRQKSARLSSLTSGGGIGIPALSSEDDESEEEEEEEEEEESGEESDSY